MLTPQQIIDHYQLEKLEPEGGYFRQMYRSKNILAQVALPENITQDKPAGTAIFYLLTDEPDVFSAMHKLPTDEIFHFYLGDPVEMVLLFPDGQSKHITLGQDILNGQHVQFVVPAGVWQGSRLLPGGRFALTGTTMAPGFTESDYLGGERDTLIQQFPHESDAITALTRPDEGLSMLSDL